MDGFRVPEAGSLSNNLTGSRGIAKQGMSANRGGEPKEEVS